MSDRKMRVVLYIDDEGRLAIEPGKDMNMIEVHTMLELGMQTVEKNIMQTSRIVDPSKGLKGLVNFS